MKSRDPGFVCPRCKGPLEAGARAYVCPACARTFPIVLGIPDFRLFPDPYISIEGDYQKARALVDMYDRMDLAGLIAHYWTITPGVPPDLVREHVCGALLAPQRARASWDAIQAAGSLHLSRSLLDVGCGTAGFLATAAPAFEHAVGVDIAFRWLIAARKRLAELGVSNATLVCACAEHLPFPDETFDLVVGEDVLDHVREQPGFIAESRRVLATGKGTLYLSTPNRFSVGPDPHVWVVGVGFLPASLRDAYVRWRRGAPYGPIHPVSYLRMRRLLRDNGFRRYQVLFPSFPTLDSARLPRWQRLQLSLYERARASPVLRHILRAIGPAFQVVGRKEA